jgi:hypothetical protein
MMPGSCFDVAQVDDGRGFAARSRRTMSRCLDRLSASGSNTHIRMSWSQHPPVAPSAEAAPNRQGARGRAKNRITLCS